MKKNLLSLAKNDDDSDDGEWLITFSDLMALLFCFFVLLTVLSIQPRSCQDLIYFMEANNAKFKNFEVRSNRLECIVSLPSDLLFESGSALIHKKNIRKFDELFLKIPKLKSHMDDLVVIEGHTDNVPIKTAKFQNNWELSSARATNIATYLINEMNYNSGFMSVRAFGESRPRIKYINEIEEKLNPEEIAYARKVNRRVELILAKKPEDYNMITLLYGKK